MPLLMQAMGNALARLTSDLQLLSKQIKTATIPIKPVEQLEPLTISVATINVLHEQYYTGYLEPNGMLLNPNNRAHFFASAMDDPDLLGDIDIICFQEWPYGTNLRSFHAKKLNEFIRLNGMIDITKRDNLNNLTDYLKIINSAKEKVTSEGYSFHGIPNATIDGVAMLINKEKFKVVLEPRPFPLEGNKSFLFLGIAPYTNLKKLIGIVSIHIPFKEPKESGEMSDEQIKFFRTLMETIKQYSDINEAKFGPMSWIICGDFNYDIWNNATDTINSNNVKSLESIFPKNLWSSSIQYKNALPTARNGNEPDKLEYLDYIFFTNNFTLTNRMQFPDSLEALKASLIRHNKTWGRLLSNYFSDHAIVRVNLTLTNTKAPVIQVPIIHAPTSHTTNPQSTPITRGITLPSDLDFGEILNALLKDWISSKISPSLELFADYFHTNSKSNYNRTKLTATFNATSGTIMPKSLTFDSNKPLEKLEIVLANDNYGKMVATVAFKEQPPFNRGTITIGAITTKPITGKGNRSLPGKFSSVSTSQFFNEHTNEIKTALNTALKNKPITIKAQ